LGRAAKLVWRAAPRVLAGSIALQVVGSAAVGIQLLLTRRLLSVLIDGTRTGNFSRAPSTVVALVVVLALAAAVNLTRTELQRLLSELVARYSMRMVIDAATAADLIAYESPEYHNRLRRAAVNASIRPVQMTQGLLSLGRSVMTSAAIGATLVSIEPIFLVFTVVAVIPVVLATLSLGRSLYRFAVEQTPVDRERHYVQDLLVGRSSAKEIRAYHLGGYLRDRFDNLYERRIVALRALVRQRTRQGLVGSVATSVISGGTVALLIYLVAHKDTSLASAGAAAAALLLLSGQLSGLASAIGTLYESSLFIHDFNDFVAPGRRVEDFPGTRPPAGPVGQISVRSAEFRYPSRRTTSLKGVDLDIRPGEVVALVGENGSGKTTLAKLLAGLYRPTAGSISWGGVDVSEVDIAAVRAGTAVLFQDFVRYLLTARENVGMGKWESMADLDSVIAAASAAGAHDFLAGLPNGYETFLGPQFFGGSDLSGGQWQRVAMARAYLRQAGLVILDEPTASLDPRAEAALFSAVRDLFAGRSVVLISHRFASVRLADRIHVMDGGRIIESGDHDELMEQAGTYAELFRLQADAFGLPVGGGADQPSPSER
jgi:ATP-binding cassette subfamily B protein